MLNWLNKKTTNVFSVPSYASNFYFSDENSLSLKKIREKVGEAKHCPPASQEWINSVYSYNKAFTKTLPATDNVVNRLIKSYFSLTPLFKGKKSRRVEIRFRRLSLNRILVSKSEIKHTNNKVIITVYLYNKNKKFLMYKLKNLYQTLLSVKQGIPKLLKKESLKGKKDNVRTNIMNEKEKGKLSLAPTRARNNATNTINERKNKNPNFLNTNNDIKVKKLGGLRRYSTNKLRIIKVYTDKPTDVVNTIQPSSDKPLSSIKSKNASNFNFKNVISNKNADSALKERSNFVPKNKQFKTKIGSLSRKPGFFFNSKENVMRVYNYINYINLTNKRLSKFFVKLRNYNLKNKYKTMLKKYYGIFSKYKLYSLNDKYFLSFSNLDLNQENVDKNNLYTSEFYNLVKGNANILNTFDFKTKRKNKKARKTFAFKKIKANKNIINLMHKLRNFYKLFLLQDQYKYNNLNIHETTLNALAPKTNILKNMFKLIKKTNASNSKKRLNAISLKAAIITNIARKHKNTILRVLKWKNENFTNYEYKYYGNFIKKAYKKEILYMYYVKLLSINNNKFKNWFLLGLKNLISKLYNKKVEFNFVNLKYLHLNSEIFSESISTKLRNRQNRLLTVLKKALRLVKLSSIDRGYNNNLPFNIDNYKYKNLNLNSFDSKNFNHNDALHQLLYNVFNIQNTENYNVTTDTYSGLKGTLDNNTDINLVPSGLKKDIVLANIKHKAVFGVRLEAAGRLSKRLTASRSVFKLKYKGSIKNVDSSIKGLSTVILRGNTRPNIQYTKISSKTRNGSFGLKGWVSGY